MTKTKSKTKPKMKPQPARPYHLLLPFVVFVALSLVYVAPQEVPNMSMAVVKCIPVLYLMGVILLKEKMGGEVTLVFIGLGVSLIGDYYLIWPDECFLEGVVSFVMAETFYILSLGFKGASWRVGVGVYGFNIVPLAYLHTLLPSPLLKIIITFYSFSLATFLWRAVDRMMYRRDVPWERRLASAAGALTLVLSDFSIGALQLGRLASHCTAQLIILSTYYIAQLLIVLGGCSGMWRV